MTTIDRPPSSPLAALFGAGYASAVPGPTVYLDIEHDANLLPWQARDGRVVTARPTLSATFDAVRRELVREHGARIAVDGAQLVPHRHVYVAASGIDYLAFSGHKVYAPFGAGVLIGRRDWLDAAPPYLAGGGAVRRVRLDATTWTDSPARHEAGTPNVLGAVALAAACRTIDDLADGAVAAHEGALLHRLTNGLSGIDGVHVLQLWPDQTERIGVVTFTVAGVPAELAAQYLSAEHAIGVRDGRFCAHLLLDRVNPGSQLRSGTDGAYLPTPDPRPLPGWLGAA